MARSLDELHEQTRKLNIRDPSETVSAEEPSSEDSTQECKCQHSSCLGRCAQCPRHPASQNDSPPDERTDDVLLNDKKDKESTLDEFHPDMPHRCIECKTDEYTTQQSPGEESTPLDGGTAQEGKGKEAEKEDEQEDEEERTLTLEELLEYREKKGLKDGDYLLEFGFGFPEEREVNLNVQIEGDFSVTVLM